MSKISHTRANHRFQSNQRLFERFNTFCLAWLGLPVSKPVPDEVKIFIVNEFAKITDNLDELEQSMDDSLHNIEDK
jgi:hypothetical protein